LHSPLADLQCSRPLPMDTAEMANSTTGIRDE
jgi:hypothetical protein